MDKRLEQNKEEQEDLKNNFLIAGGVVIPGNHSSNIIDELPVAMYDLIAHPAYGLCLLPTRDVYEFNYKLYDLDDDFVLKAKIAYQNLKNNLGVLLTGQKGTGKTVTAKRICNTMNLPVIRVAHAYDGLAKFISTIHQEVVIFIDEYEKVFRPDETGEQNHDLLQVMDGALTNEHRKMFILTTNTEKISEYMLNRPSRIRYVKKYGNLSKKVYTEIISDHLKHPALLDATILAVSKLSVITVDTVKQLVEEVNIFNTDPIDWIDIFNVTQNKAYYKIYGTRYTNGVMMDEFHHITNLSTEVPDWVEGIFATTSFGSYVGFAASTSIKVEKIDATRAYHWIELSSSIAPFGTHMWPNQAYEIVNGRLTVKLLVEVVSLANGEVSPFKLNDVRFDGKTNFDNMRKKHDEDPNYWAVIKAGLEALPIINKNDFDAKSLNHILDRSTSCGELLRYYSNPPVKANVTKAKRNRKRPNTNSNNNKKQVASSVSFFSSNKDNK